MKLRNKFERRTARQLKRNKIDFEYESVKIPYVIESVYIPDFVFKKPSGELLLIEDKGYLRPEDKRKLLAVKKQNPSIDIRILFYAPVPKQMKWAEKNKILYAIGKIPKEWIKEIKGE